MASTIPALVRLVQVGALKGNVTIIALSKVMATTVQTEINDPQLKMKKVILQNIELMACLKYLVEAMPKKKPIKAILSEIAMETTNTTDDTPRMFF